MMMHKWLDDIISSSTKKPMPVLSFPCVQLLGISVQELISSSDMQSKGMKAIASRVDSLASVSFMDLSLEAEAFGAKVKFSDMEVPTVTGTLIEDMEAAEKLQAPSLDKGRLGIYLEGVKRATALINDRPVFAGIIGPFSLTGRLVDVNKAMLYCKKKPDLLHQVLRKTTSFLIEYAKAYRDAGANGIVMAEPLTGMLSPRLAEEFSEPYVKEIADAVKSEGFLVIYHNCGNSTIKMAESIKRTGCNAYHFGNAIDLKTMLDFFPEDIPVMGNIDPAQQFTNGTPESISVATRALLEKCASHSNFVISSGCDIPPTARWDNIDAFFNTVKDFYNEKQSFYL